MAKVIERKPVKRSLILRTQAGAVIRTAKFEDRDHIVVPVVALVEGVIWPANAQKPELVLAEEFTVAPSGWNGRPVFCGHPVRNGEYVSGNSPQILETERFGTVFNADITDDDRLTMEAWLDPVRAVRVGQHAVDTIERAKKGEPIEISTGVLVVSENKQGAFRGQKYFSIWRQITPDHLALLPAGDIGACSIEMGCGVRAASKHPIVHIITAKGIEMADKKKEKGASLRERINQFIETIRGAQTAQDLAAEEAAELVQFTTIQTLLQQAGTTNTEALDIVAQLIADETENPTEGAAEEEAEEKVENARLDALYALAGASIDTLYKVLNLVGQCLMEDAAEEYPRYAKGARHSKVDQKMLQSVHDNAVTLGAVCDESMKTSSGHGGCGCGGNKNNSTGEPDVNKEQRIAALMANKFNPVKDKASLDAMTDVGLQALEQHCKTLEQNETQAAADKKATDDKIAELQANASKPLTEDDPRLPESVRQIIVNHKSQQAARHNDLVGKLKANGAFTEDELKAMSLPELERLAKVAKIDAAPVDFSGQGMPHISAQSQQSGPSKVPAPPSLTDALKANSSKQATQ